MAASVISRFTKAAAGTDLTRSVRIHFTNATDRKLTLASNETSAKWVITPPSIIQPNTHVDFKSGTSLRSNTVKGDVKYSVEGGGSIGFQWGNPAVGYNWYEQSSSSGLKLSRDGDGKGSYAQVAYKLEKVMSC